MDDHSCRLAADDDGGNDVGDRDGTVMLRLAVPDSRHCETGEPIGALQNELPHGVSFQVQSRNLEGCEIVQVLVAIGEVIGFESRLCPARATRVATADRFTRASVA